MQNSAEQCRLGDPLAVGNFNKSVAQAAEPLCDLDSDCDSDGDLDSDGDCDGDSVVNSGDLSILWLSTNFNKGAVTVP